MVHTEIVAVSWERFCVSEGASRAEILAAGRVACRTAFVRAAAQWSERYGAAPWADAKFDHEENGAPTLLAAGAPLISLCHCRGLAGCALAAPGHACVGIDAELAGAPAMKSVRELAERSGESALPWPHEDWPARLWCAKEAVVKAERIAADALGRTLTVIEVQSAAVREGGGDQSTDAPTDALDVFIRSHKGNVFRVATQRIGEFVVASVKEKAPPHNSGGPQTAT